MEVITASTLLIKNVLKIPKAFFAFPKNVCTFVAEYTNNSLSTPTSSIVSNNLSKYPTYETILFLFRLFVVLHHDAGTEHEDGGQR